MKKKYYFGIAWMIGVVLLSLLFSDKTTALFFVVFNGVLIFVVAAMDDPDDDLFNDQGGRQDKTHYISQEVKQEVLERQRGACAFCPETTNLVFHHKQRVSDGGRGTVDNIVALCPNHHALAHSKNIRANYTQPTNG